MAAINESKMNTHHAEQTLDHASNNSNEVADPEKHEIAPYQSRSTDDDEVTLKTWAVVTVCPQLAVRLANKTGPRRQLWHIVLASTILQHNPRPNVCILR